MINQYNQSKTLLLLDDITNESITSDDLKVCASNYITVQEFSYCYFRHIDESSFQCGPTQHTVLNLTIKSPSQSKIKTLYEQLHSQEYYSYTLLFNPYFPISSSLPTYQGGIVGQGYVVGISEEFDSASENGMLMKIEVVLQSVTYLSTSEKKTKKTLILNKI